MSNGSCPPDWNQLLPKIEMICRMKNLWGTFQNKMWKKKLILHQFLEFVWHGSQEMREDDSENLCLSVTVIVKK